MWPWDSVTPGQGGPSSSRCGHLSSEPADGKFGFPLFSLLTLMLQAKPGSQQTAVVVPRFEQSPVACYLTLCVCCKFKDGMEPHSNPGPWIWELGTLGNTCSAAPSAHPPNSFTFLMHSGGGRDWVHKFRGLA